MDEGPRCIVDACRERAVASAQRTDTELLYLVGSYHIEYTVAVQVT